MIALLDCHYPLDDTGDRSRNPWARLEEHTGRAFNAALTGALEAQGIEHRRVQIDHHRPQSQGAAMALKVAGVQAAGARACIETHCNWHESRAVRGWCVIHGPGDALGQLLAEAIAERWAPVVREAGLGTGCPVREREDLYLCRALPELGMGFCLPELGNLEIPKVRAAIDNRTRGRVWWRLVEGVAAAALEVLHGFE